ncbi:tetratricopeptide repeat protein, partial [Candidatus Poribacteria bacterium]|nr:tetratricopeptide repeat protein [Candidatus Poribacteria bacterium]
TLAQLYYKQRRYGEALQEMSKVIQLAPDNPKYKRHWKVIRNVAQGN